MRRLWSWDSSAVYVASDARYERLSRGERGCFPVGHHWENVFIYDESLAGKMDELFEAGAWDWQKLRPMRLQVAT